ncbi:unnamed protein product [Prorocentrum cordatum]|uniref:Uncharacterized protein n=1 Tax=Prorocentrum cordatum TaxID=2364126 RepID=A0ABN9UAP4_9DINO|nr:unnamed protein product [Polarella glacialis]
MGASPLVLLIIGRHILIRIVGRMRWWRADRRRRTSAIGVRALDRAPAPRGLSQAWAGQGPLVMDGHGCTVQDDFRTLPSCSRALQAASGSGTKHAEKVPQRTHTEQ